MKDKSGWGREEGERCPQHFDFMAVKQQMRYVTSAGFK